MHIYLEQCSECGGWHSVLPPVMPDATSSTNSSVCRCIEKEKHKELLDESLSEYKAIWASLAKK